MATLKDALDAGWLEAFELPEWEPRCPIRSLYVSPGLLDWGDYTPELHDPKRAIGGRTLFEQLVQMLCDFRCSEHVHYGDIRRIMPTKKGIWHMYPNGLRVYGWCPAKHSFVAITGALEIDTKKDKRLNDKKRDEVLNFISSRKLEKTVLMGEFYEVFPHED